MDTVLLSDSEKLPCCGRCARSDPTARAEEIYIQNGRTPGGDVENCTQAAREIIAHSAKQKRPSAIVLKVNGVEHVGEYQPELPDGWVPGESGIGSSVNVRFQGDRVFVKRMHGKELATRSCRRWAGYCAYEELI